MGVMEREYILHDKHLSDIFQHQRQNSVQNRNNKEIHSRKNKRIQDRKRV